MSNYVKTTDFAVKDTLTTGDPAKVVKGTEIDDEFQAIEAAISTKVDDTGDTMSGDLTFADNAKVNLGTSSDMSIYHDGTNNKIDLTNGKLVVDTDTLVVDGTNNRVGIGTTTPTTKLNVDASVASNELVYFNNTSATSSDVLRLNTAGVGSGTTILDVQSGSDTKFCVLGTGNVGIGTTSPSNTIHAYHPTDNEILLIESGDPSANISFKDSATVTAPRIGATGDDFRFIVGAGGEAMRIDASGKLLVGKATSGSATAGLELDGLNDVALFTRGAGQPLILNRLSNDGSIIELRKDGTTMGSIGSFSGYLNLWRGNAGIALNSNSVAVTPSSSTGESDNTIDIGRAGARFKNLYLSGGVYVGGTTSANYLDDYEEGTFTCTLSVGTVTNGATGYYTKVGRTVSIVIAGLRGTDISNAGQFVINGLPFTNQTSTNGSCMVSYTNKTDTFQAFSTSGATTVALYQGGNTGTFDWLTYSDFNSASHTVYINMTYIAA